MLRTAFAFALGKGAVFLVPLLASVVVSATNYGRLEFALALGAPLAATVSLGLPSSYAFFSLKQNRPDYTPVIRRLFGIVVALMLLLSLGYALVAGITARLTLGGVVAAALVAQNSRSSYLKMSAQPARAATFDGGVYYCILVALIAVFAGQREEQFVLSVSITLAVWAIVLAARPLSQLTSLRRERLAIREILYYGSSVFLAGVVTSTAANTAKLAAGRFLGAAALGEYAALSRVTMATLMVYQLLLLASYREVYSSESQAANRFHERLLLLTMPLALGLAFLCAWGPLPEFFPILKEICSRQPLLPYFCAIQMLSWIVMANVELYAYRDGQARVVLLSSLLAVALGWSCFFIADYFGTLTLWAVSAAQTLLFLIPAMVLMMKIKKEAGLDLWVLRRCSVFLALAVGALSFIACE